MYFDIWKMKAGRTTLKKMTKRKYTKAEKIIMIILSPFTAFGAYLIIRTIILGIAALVMTASYYDRMKSIEVGEEKDKVTETLGRPDDMCLLEQREQAPKQQMGCRGYMIPDEKVCGKNIMVYYADDYVYFYYINDKEIVCDIYRTIR